VKSTELAASTKPPEQTVKPALEGQREVNDDGRALGTTKYSRSASRKEKNREGGLVRRAAAGGENGLGGLQETGGPFNCEMGLAQLTDAPAS
jgi:hypothetical protein